LVVFEDEQNCGLQGGKQKSRRQTKVETPHACLSFLELVNKTVDFVDAWAS